MVMLETIPGELHLEILRMLDVPSLFAMRSVNRYFRQLMDENEETVVRGCLKKGECVGPHAILLHFYPLTDPENTTFSHARRMHEMKVDTISVARMVQRTHNAKIDALYCIRHTCKRFQNFYFPPSLVRLPQLELEAIRRDLLGEYTTQQIQHMLPLYIRLVYKTAELLQYDFRGRSLECSLYYMCNNYILVEGPDLLLQLEKLSPSKDCQKLREELFQRVRPYTGYFGMVHEELINELQRRGSGLMTGPGIEIQQFLQEENTTFDIFNDWNEIQMRW